MHSQNGSGREGLEDGMKNAQPLPTLPGLCAPVWLIRGGSHNLFQLPLRRNQDHIDMYEQLPPAVSMNELNSSIPIWMDKHTHRIHYFKCV